MLVGGGGRGVTIVIRVEGGDIGLEITLVPKVFILFVGLKTLGSLLNLDWLVEVFKILNQ